MTVQFAGTERKSLDPVRVLLKDAFRAYAAVFPQLSTLLAVLYTSYFLAFRLLGIPFTGQAEAGQPALPAFKVLLPVLTGMVLSLIHTLAAARLTQACAEGELIGWREALHHAWRKAGAGFLASFFSLLILMGASILLIIPGVILGVYYSLNSYAVSLKGMAGWDALNESRNLVQGNWWAVAIRLLAVGFVCMAASLAINAAFTPFRSVLDAVWPLKAVPFLLQQFVSSFSYIAMTLLFLNLDAIKSSASPRF